MLGMYNIVELEGRGGAKMTLHDQILDFSCFELVKVVEEKTHLDTATKSLRLISAQFTDNNGNIVTIKRSKCRHYYIKVGSLAQDRVSLETIKDKVCAY